MGETPAVHRLSEKCIAVDMLRAGPEWRGHILLQSDQHFDSTHCDRDLLKQHLDECVAANGRALFLGDWWDAMQGKSDRRGSKGALRPEYKSDRYLNHLVEDTAEFLAPYAHHIAGWARGNHETSIVRHTEFDLLSATIRELNQTTGSNILTMGYTGWVFFRVFGPRKKKTKADGSAAGGPEGVKRLYYTHGSGGGGPVTKGVIQTNRRATYLPDADVVCAGHIHEAWMMEIVRERISSAGSVAQDTQLHLQLPSYKDEFGVTGDGWWHETGKSPRPKGAWWLEMGRHSRVKNARQSISLAARRAT